MQGPHNLSGSRHPCNATKSCPSGGTTSQTGSGRGPILISELLSWNIHVDSSFAVVIMVTGRLKTLVCRKIHFQLLGWVVRIDSLVPR